LKTLFRLEPISQEQIEERRRQRAAAAARPRFQMASGPAAGAGPGAPPSPFAPRAAGPPQPAKPQTVVRQGDKVGRNDPCPCGSGKKYKKCHGAASQVAT
jgi:preprotein translocase subunit SecA